MSGDNGVLVLKLGSNALVDPQGRLDPVFMGQIAAQLVRIRAQGWRPVVVSSGAVACGLHALRLSQRPDAVSDRQALAAIGQAGLMRAWQEAFIGPGLTAAQFLLTADDFRHRQRWLNLGATFQSCFAYGVIPIVNENDTVVIEELTVGDNDRLSALVAGALGAVRLVLGTDIDGYYDRDPRVDPTARLVPHLERVTPAMLAAAGEAGARGRGGMRSKMQAAALASGAGVAVTIARARTPDLLLRLLAGEPVGTSIAPRPGDRQGARRRWLGLTRAPKGRLVVDDGARRALVEQGRSLLPAGITAVEGSFARGDVVAIVDPTGHELARGLAELAAAELTLILGQRLERAAAILGQPVPKSAVHRDNLLMLA